MKIKISRREAKESVYWLRLILTYNNEILETERSGLIDGGTQTRKILSAILNKLGFLNLEPYTSHGRRSQ